MVTYVLSCAATVIQPHNLLTCSLSKEPLLHLLLIVVLLTVVNPATTDFFSKIELKMKIYQKVDLMKEILSCLGACLRGVEYGRTM
jgi:multisubunit Na+/H+ antiporter MnhG subunit